MNRILIVTMFFAIILGNNTLFAQTRSGKLFNAAKDTLVINATKDTLATNTVKDSLAAKNEMNVTADTTSYLFVVHHDSVPYNPPKTYNKDAFKFKYDAFREKMKEPWLGGILKDIFF